MMKSPPECPINLNSLDIFVRQINERILNELNFYEINSLTINVNELFDCSAKVHFRNESFDTNAHKIDNCFKYLDTLKSIYANKDFGICFEFFAKNYSIYLKDDDYFEIIFKYNAQRSLLVNAFQEMNERFMTFISRDREFSELKTIFKLHFDIYFALYFIIDPKTRLFPHNRDIALKSTRNSLNAELRITKTNVELLSKPYMKKCIGYGKL